MKIIINTSNLFVGGGVQVALSFIDELKKLKRDDFYYIFLSSEIEKQLSHTLFPSNFKFYSIKYSPASIFHKIETYTLLNKLEQSICPDIVFTVFGPSYWTPKSKHLMGLATGWIYNPNSVAYHELSFVNLLKVKLGVVYKKFFIKYNTNNYVVETEDAKSKIINYLNINNPIFVIGNTYSSIFNNKDYLLSTNEYFLKLPIKTSNTFRFVLISHNYSHKNLRIISKIIPLLRAYKECNIQFVLTIDSKSYDELFFDFKDNVLNLGTVIQKNCPSIYSQCDALFFPTLLETFSASYPEAMKLKLPILTSNFSFSRDICGDAALYFNPLDEYDIVNKIIYLIKSKEVRDSLVLKGTERLKNFESAESRALKYLNLLEQISEVE